MLQYLINVTDNTFISAVIVALLISTLRIVGTQPKKIIWSSLLLGCLVALVYAILKRNTGTVIREYYDLVLLCSWGIFIIPTVFCIWICYIKQKRANMNAWWQLSVNCGITLLLALVFALFMPNLLLYPFAFDVGMDSIFNTDYLFKWLGYTAAIILMLLITLFICRITYKLANKLVLIIISIALAIFTIQNFITIAQIMIVRRIIAYQQWLMDLIIFVLSHGNFFIFVFICISLLLTLMLYIKSKTTPLNGQNPAQIRKIKANIRQDRRKVLMIMAATAITAFTVTRLRYLYEKGVEISPAEPIGLNSNGLLVIPLTKVNDSKLHRFGYTTQDGTIVRFIIIKKSENAYGVGLDACDICGASGYYQRGDQVVCSLCDVVMNIATIGFPGGCNPVPLKFQVNDGNIVIKPKYLEAEKNRFK
ncbi:DUF2318 domain-containing protein [Frischella sp. Ac48]|uniref:DUF2318 domain-containing protein n=1 Tax=Frischella sp. Ac48 TaxID=2804531 RepID=UPI001C7CC82F|nr:DUF2318 domain-containing protein [Frischella sp. Ac48]MBX4133376.1 DUF2318 domain-containing protein [Frischella sp. Ac48]